MLPSFNTRRVDSPRHADRGAWGRGRWETRARAEGARQTHLINTCLSVYRELATMLRSCLVSAWKVCCEACASATTSAAAAGGVTACAETSARVEKRSAREGASARARERSSALRAKASISAATNTWKA